MEHPATSSGYEAALPMVGWREQPGMLPALSIRQPWAEAILAGVKSIETRTWRTSYRGPLVLHASQRWWQPRRMGDAAARDEAERIARRLGLALPVEEYPRGALVGIARVVEVFAFSEESWERLRSAHGIDVGWQPPRAGWRLGEVRRFARAIPAWGALGLFAVSAELVAEAEDGP